MAKGNAMGLWKGKKGSTVFYQIANSNSKQKQGMRERNYEPSNPQSYSQAGQRMKMYPAQAVYGALKSTIERSWQGVKYGQMTRQAYLKSALRSEFFPAVSKGDGVVVPGPYQIAKGSLQEVVAYLNSSGEAYIRFLILTPASTDPTFGELSNALLEGNPWLQEGDQITVVLCYTNDRAVTRFNWWVRSFYIDPNNQTALISGDNLFNPPGIDVSFNGNGLVFIPIDEQFIYAASCIVSREDTTPLRSNATLSVNAAALPDYYDVNAIANARKSYQKQEYVRDVDWPVDPEGGEESSTYVTITAYAYPEETPSRGTITGAGRYERGTLVALSATPAQGYKLIGWYPSAEDAEARTNLISTAGTLTFTAGDSSAVGGTTTFYARFDLAG